MLSFFDVTALLLVAVAYFTEYRKGNVTKFILIYLVLCNITSIINPNNLGELDYILKIAIDALFIISLIRINPPPLLLKVIFASMVYNGFAYIEYNSEYMIIYNLYAPVMYLLTSILVYIAFNDGVRNGIDSDNCNRVNNHTDNIDNRIVSDGETF
jgi:hypothetical protein